MFKQTFLLYNVNIDLSNLCNSPSGRNSVNRHLIEIQTIQRAHHNSLAVRLDTSDHVKIIFFHFAPVTGYYVTCVAYVYVQAGLRAKTMWTVIIIDCETFRLLSFKILFTPLALICKIIYML